MRVDLAFKAFFRRCKAGENPGYPRFFVQSENALAKAQRKLSKQEKETPEYNRALKAVRHVHEKTANRRDDFAQKTSKNLVGRFGTNSFREP